MSTRITIPVNIQLTTEKIIVIFILNIIESILLFLLNSFYKFAILPESGSTPED